MRSTYSVASIHRSSPGKSVTANKAAAGTVRRCAARAARHNAATRTMVAAAVPRNRSSTKVVSNAPPTLPTVDSANTLPAVRDVTVASDEHGRPVLLEIRMGLGSYRTAWLLLQNLRAAMVRLERERLTGMVEVDETYVGGAEEDVRGRQLVSKCVVLVAVELECERMGRIRLRHVADASGGSLGEFVRDRVEPGSTVHTDCWRGYTRLERAGYVHRATLTHRDAAVTVAEFSHVHCVTSLLKRWLMGTQQGGVGPKHLQGYLDEFSVQSTQLPVCGENLLPFSGTTGVARSHDI